MIFLFAHYLSLDFSSLLVDELTTPLYLYTAVVKQQNKNWSAKRYQQIKNNTPA